MCMNYRGLNFTGSNNKCKLQTYDTPKQEEEEEESADNKLSSLN